MQSNQPVKVLRVKVREYAEREGVSIRTVRRWIEKEAIRVDRVGPTKRVRVRVDDEYHE